MSLNLHDAAMFRRAIACFENRQYMQAQEICVGLLARDKRAVQVLELLSEIMIRWQKHHEAIPYLEKAVAIEPKSARLWVLLGRAFMAVGKYSEAIARLEKAHRINPKDSYCHTLLADTFQKRGDPAKARPLLQPYIQAGTEDAIMAGVWAVMELEAGHPQPAVDLIVKHVERGPVDYGMFFVLGKAYEKLGDADKAFEAYTRANTMNDNPFVLEHYIHHVMDLLEVFTAENLSRLPRARTTSELPIFVTGRPRSGTTLVETILNAHPAVHGAGDLEDVRRIAVSMKHEIGSNRDYPHCILDLEQEDVDRFSNQYLDRLRSLGRNAKRVTDKSMGVNLNMGVIQLIVPKARVIWVRRNPVDNCFACYTEDLVFSHTYAQDLRHLGVTYWFYEKSMRHWQKVLDLPILELQYEELVQSPEEWTRRIVDFAGLEWNDACLRFHDTKKFAVRTTALPSHSYAQVRKPIYKTSVGRAEIFKKHLQPLFDALAEGEAMVKGSIPLPQRAAPVQMTEEIAASLEQCSGGP